MKFPKMKKNETFLGELLDWLEIYANWFKEGWKYQAVIQKIQKDIEEIVFLHFYPIGFIDESRDFKEESKFSERETTFLQSAVSWDEVETIIKYFLQETNKEIQFIRQIPLKKDKNTRIELKDFTYFHSNINKTPFKPHYVLTHRLCSNYDDSEIIINTPNVVYRSIKNSIIDIFLKDIAKMDSRIEERISLPCFQLSIPIQPIILNKINYDSQNLLINFSLNNFGTGCTSGVVLLPYDRRKHFFEHKVIHDHDNIISADFGSYLEFHIYQLNSDKIPNYLLLKGRMGVSEEEITELDLESITTESILKICEQGENQYYEFKDQKILDKEGRTNLLLEIAAFANTSSGFIFIGVGDLPENKGEILGIEEAMTKRSKTKEGLISLITENWIKELDPIPLVFGRDIDIKETEHSVICLKIEFDGSKTPVTYHGKIVTRVNTSVNPASQAEIVRLINKENRHGYF